MAIQQGESMEPNKGGLYWGRVNAGSLARVGTWAHVVLNDSQINGPENNPANAAAYLRERSKASVWHSINGLGVFIDPRGNPSAYWPAQQRLWQAAEHSAGWLTKGNGAQLVEQQDSWGRVRYFDLGVKAMQYALATEMAAASHGVHGIFLDEAHRTIADIRARHPGINRTDSEWREGMRRTLRAYALLMKGKPLPVVTNGTFGREDSALVSGRFWQAVSPDQVPGIIADSEGARYTMLHSFGELMSPADIAALSVTIREQHGCETCYQWTAGNGPFTSDYIPDPVAWGV